MSNTCRGVQFCCIAHSISKHCDCLFHLFLLILLFSCFSHTYCFLSSLWLFGTSFGTDLTFSNFLNFIFTWDWSWPPCFLCSHDLCLFLFLCFILHMITWPREVIIILWSFWLRSSTLWMHPHPHFLLPPPQPHHPYTPRLHWSMTAPLGEGSHQDKMYGPEEDLACNAVDSPHSRLGTAKVKWVLTSTKSAQPNGLCCREPSPD